MGDTPGRRQWIAVLVLLGGAAVALLLLLGPEVWSGGAGRRHLAGDAAGAGLTEARDPAAEAAAEADEAAVEREVPAESEEQIPYGDRSLPRDRSIRGRVLDPQGDPVADAVLTATFKETRTRPYAHFTASRVRSEKDGFFVLGPLEKRAYHVLAVKGGAVGQAANQNPGAWTEIVLSAGARITGKVTVRESGEPVAGAAVIIKDGSLVKEAATDEEGKYLLEPLPPTLNAWSGQQVVVVADGYRRAERTNLLLRIGQEHRLDFPLEKGRSLTGKVLDAQSLRPVEGAVVGEGWEPYHRTTTSGKDGEFELGHVDVSPNLIFTVRADAYLPQQRQSDGTGTLEFKLDATLQVEGIVWSPKEQPVPGARVYLHRITYAPGFQPTGQSQGKNFTTTDAEGRFRFADVLPGQVGVIAFHRELAPAEAGPLEIRSGGPAPEPVDVTLRHGLTVEGEVRDLRDNPLPSIQVRLQRNHGRIPGYQWIQNYVWSEVPTWYSDASGRFVLRGALPGKHWLSAWDTTYGWTSTQIEGQEGQRIDGVILSFAGSTIVGVFLTSDGDPVPGASIQARGPKNAAQRGWRWTQTDGLGRFRMGGLKEGLYDITAHSAFGSAKPLKDVQAGAADLEIRLDATQVLRGEVRSVLSGRPLERFTLMIQPKRGRGGGMRRAGGGGSSYWQGEVRTPDGRFERPVVPGTYTVTAKAPGHAPRVTEEVIVEENLPPQEVYLGLDAGGGIQGTVRDAEGKPLRNAHLYARVHRNPGETPNPRDRLLQAYDSTDSKGRYFMEGMAAGTYLVMLNLGTRGSAQALVTVQGTEMATQDLRLLPTGLVLFRVVDEESNPVEGVSFQFRDENGGWIGWARYTSAQGLTTSQPLRMGPCTVKAWHRTRAYLVDDFPVNVVSGQTIQVDVVMKKKETPPEQPPR